MSGQMLSAAMLTTQRAARLRLAAAMAEQAEQVGKRLTEARGELGLTRPQMARRFSESSVTDDYIYRWETGKVMPSEAYQAGIIEHYELDGLADLMGGPKSERTPKPETPSADDIFRSKDVSEIIDRLLDRLSATQSKLDAALAENADLQRQLDAAGNPPAHRSTQGK